MKTLAADSAILAMPSFLRKEVLTSFASASPYNRYASGSYYSKEGKTWEHTPENLIRVSDHWNFFSQGQRHCVTDRPVDAGTWSVGIYDSISKIYKITNSYKKDFTALKIREKRKESKPKDILIQIKEKVRAKNEKKLKLVERKKRKDEATKRAEAIAAGHIYYFGTWTEYYSRAGGRGKRYFSSSVFDKSGKVNSESACRTNGKLIKNYIEIDKRDYNEKEKETLNFLKTLGKNKALDFVNDFFSDDNKKRIAKYIKCVF